MDVLHKLSTYLYKKFAYSKMKSDHRGLTLVELICAIAIMSLVGAGVSGFMIVGANTYRSGTTEVELQTEAQMVVNQIGDLVIDTTAVVKGYDESGAEVEENATTITIDSIDRHYQISYSKGAEGTAGKIYYSEYQVLADGTMIALPDESSKNQLMAENVTDFKSDIRDFQSSGILRLYIRLEKDNRVYASYYTITARNGSYTVEGGGVDISANVVAPSEIVVEPNQDYVLSAAVVGVSNNAVKWSLSGNYAGDTYVIQETDGWHLHVGSSEISNNMRLTVSTVAMNGTEPLDTTYVKVYLRRVNELDLYGVLISGQSMKEGAVYRISPEFVGFTLDRLLGSESDLDYVDPYTFTWLTAELTGADGTASEYFDFEPHGTYADLTLKKELTSGTITVSARALHPDGMNGAAKTNKSGVSYSSVIGEWTLSSGFQIRVSGDWGRGGNTGFLLENVPDEWLITWDNGETHNDITLNWWIWKTWLNGSAEGDWSGPNTQGYQGAFGDGQSTNLGLIVEIEQGNSLALKEYLSYNKYSYSSPYFVNDYDQSASRLKLELTFHAADGSDHVAEAVLDVPDVSFQFRNSLEGSWSSESGGHIVYITDEDTTDTYESYFMLSGGWSKEVEHSDFLDGGEDDDYIAYNRFVGVIADEEGYKNDLGKDLTFVNDSHQTFTRPTTRHTDMNVEKISYGSGQDCRVAVKVSQEEKNELCVGAGTIVKEIYEYNYLFNTQELATAYDHIVDWGPKTVDMYESADGCDGYLEYHFVPANIASTVVGPTVRYCPLLGDKALDVNNIYYINDRERFQVLSESSAVYQTKNGDSWNTVLNLSLSSYGVGTTMYYTDATKTKRYVVVSEALVYYQEMSGDNTWNTIKALTWAQAKEELAPEGGVKKGVKVLTETNDSLSYGIQTINYYINDTERYAVVPDWNNEVYYQKFEYGQWVTVWNKLNWDDVKGPFMDEDGIDDDVIVESGTISENKWVAN